MQSTKPALRTHYEAAKLYTREFLPIWLRETEERVARQRQGFAAQQPEPRILPRLFRQLFVATLRHDAEFRSAVRAWLEE